MEQGSVSEARTYSVDPDSQGTVCVGIGLGKTNDTFELLSGI